LKLDFSHIESNNIKQIIESKYRIDSSYKTIKWTCLNCGDIFTKQVLKTDNNYVCSNNCKCGRNKYAITTPVV
jgi:lysyl-tRNA synthetase class I